MELREKYRERSPWENNTALFIIVTLGIHGFSFALWAVQAQLLLFPVSGNIYGTQKEPREFRSFKEKPL